MADERDASFPYDLAKLGEDELRQQFNPAIQPVPFLRTLALTELEKRRQKRMGAIKEKNLSVGKAVVWTIALAAVAGAVLLWPGQF